MTLTGNSVYNDYMEATSTPTACKHADLIVKNGIVRCSDIACDTVIDATAAGRGGIIERNQTR